MAGQTITVVVLPAGPAGPAAGGKLAANIYLSPRLSGAALLSAFPDWLAWPELIQQHGLTFEVECGGRTATVAADRAGLRPDVWREIFSPQTTVAEYPQPDYDKRLIVSYPVRDAFAFLQYAYQSAAIPSSDDSDRLLGALLYELSFRDGDTSTLDDVLSSQRVAMWRLQQGIHYLPTPVSPPPTAPPARAAASGARAALTEPSNTRLMIERFALYHHLAAAKNRPPLPSTPADFGRLLDFHTAVSALTAYPALMRSLGLVVPVELPDSLCPPSPSGGSYLTLTISALSPGWPWSITPAIAPLRTSYIRNVPVFAAAPAAAPGGPSYPTGDVVDGFLVLGADSFQLMTVDLDGALLKALTLADNVAFAPDPSQIEQVLPALRSGGVSLIANGRAQQVLAAIQANKAFEAALAGGQTPRPLNAVDLVRGYRLDIWSARTSQWHSLHRRDGTYRFGPDDRVVITTADEEGFTQLAVTQPADDPTRPIDPVAAAAGAPQPGTDLYVNERIARWNGWSLSAPRPGTPLNRSPDPARAADPDPTAGSAPTPFKMTSSFTAHRGSLPELRFGDRYRVRARTVDLAGFSVGLGAQAPAPVVTPAAGGTLPYLRYEPVGPPVLVLRTVPGPGGSHAQLVIRSRNTDPSLDGVPTSEVDERHVAPPRAAVLLAEHHGMLDDAQGYLKGDPATYQMIVERDRGEFPVADGAPIDPGSQLTVPYLPDPIARGAAFANLPNTPANTRGVVTGGKLSYETPPDVQAVAGSVTRIGFPTEWPDSQAFRIMLAEGSGEPGWQDAGRVLTVPLAKADSVTVGLSCYVDPPDLELLGVWQWILELYEAAEASALQAGAGTVIVQLASEYAQLTRLVLDGGHEMITPALDVTLVHAVQQPLGRPVWSRLPIVHEPQPPAPSAVPALANAFWEITAWRYAGSHATVLLGALAISARSTAAIDIDAVWTEWQDGVSQPAPTRTPAASHVDRIPIVSLEDGVLYADGSQARAVAQYIGEIDTLWFAAPFDSLPGVTPPDVVAAPVHQHGDTKHRCIQYRAVASSRFQEYFTEPGLDFTRTSAPIMVDVPSSARPLAPDVLYVIPTFGWERQESTNLKSEVRLGNGLRVYLNRPWYSSGEGELLGVVLWPGSQPPPDDTARETYKAFFTQWGLDPIWDPGTLPAVPSIVDFTATTYSGTGLALEETSLLVDVAGHAVAFDETRGLWYCDVIIDAWDTYEPFVRLAVARYQPSSIPGVELSHVVLTDFAQLTPTRSASVTIDPASPATARLVVGGPAPGGPTQSVVTVTVEERAENIGTDLGWVPAPAARASVTEDSPAPGSPTSVLWSGTIKFATTPEPGTFRVVVREFEVFEIDLPDTPASAAPLARAAYGQRLIYASILPSDYWGN